MNIRDTVLFRTTVLFKNTVFQRDPEEVELAVGAYMARLEEVERLGIELPEFPAWVSRFLFNIKILYCISYSMI